MKFRKVEGIPGTTLGLWGCMKGPFTFIISKEEEGFHASVKVVGAKPFDGGTQYLGPGPEGLGELATFEEAVEACEKFYRESMDPDR